MVWQIPIVNYSAYVSGNKGDTWTRFVLLRDDGNDIRGVIEFRKSDQLPNASDSDIGNGKRRARFYLHENEYKDVIDLLRNEKPLYLQYIGPTAIWIGTSGLEPIGENE